MSTTNTPIAHSCDSGVTSQRRSDNIFCMTLDLFGSTGKRIKALRTSRDINQKELVTALKSHGVDVGPSFISQVETSRKQPPLEMVVALAKILRTTTDYLLMVTDDPTPVISTESQLVIDVESRTERALLEDWLELMEDLEPERRDSVLRAVRLLLSPPQPPQPPQPRVIE